MGLILRLPWHMFPRWPTEVTGVLLRIRTNTLGSLMSSKARGFGHFRKLSEPETGVTT
jgi:hypothetical protein